MDTKDSKCFSTTLMTMGLLAAAGIQLHHLGPELAAKFTDLINYGRAATWAPSPQKMPMHNRAWQERRPAISMVPRGWGCWQLGCGLRVSVSNNHHFCSAIVEHTAISCNMPSGMQAVLGDCGCVQLQLQPHLCNCTVRSFQSHPEQHVLRGDTKSGSHASRLARLSSVPPRGGRTSQPAPASLDPPTHPCGVVSRCVWARMRDHTPVLSPSQQR